jgi:hypothetical protein
LVVGGEALGLDVVETWAPGRKLFNSCWAELSVMKESKCLGFDDLMGIELE